MPSISLFPRERERERENWIGFAIRDAGRRDVRRSLVELFEFRIYAFTGVGELFVFEGL